jgi:phosphoglycerol transferase MdoB-like AlkP superfamily enzyme
MRSYFQKLLPYLKIFLIIQLLLRVTLVVRSVFEYSLSFTDVIKVFGYGLIQDSATAFWVLLPVMVFLFLCPARLIRSAHWFYYEFVLRIIFVFALLFDFVAEHLFWSEFSTRFNFIAVDYLVYTQEVIGNIKESYPLTAIIISILVVSILISYFTLREFKVGRKIFWINNQRFAVIAILTTLGSGLYFIGGVSHAQLNNWNVQPRELASNGIYNLFHAFFNNEINYENFYIVQEKDQVLARIRGLIKKEFSDQIDANWAKEIISANAEQHKNVMLVVMESMSAEFMTAFGESDAITPNLDELAANGLLFTNVYATGTRTIRGLEAITLSLPPTPGQSIVRRPGNANLYSLGFVFKDRGYETKFIYGGYSYFDNMKTFFANNGFDVVDRTNFQQNEISFANIWGVSDEDLFARTIREANEAYKQHTPFFYMIMTTSNHRPYSYPEGKIDIPPKTGRKGGVKYADYAIGKFIEWAKKEPWFNDTIFVFTADHTASSAGKIELDFKKYHIPFIIYAPNQIKPDRFNGMTSQIDVAPVLLGLLNFHYQSKFFGSDVLQESNYKPRAFISNYQKVSLFQDGVVTVLMPKQQVKQYSASGKVLENINDDLLADAVAYYQSASLWRESQRNVNTLVE